MAERQQKRDVQLEFAFDRLLPAKLEQIYDMLVPDPTSPTRLDFCDFRLGFGG